MLNANHKSSLLITFQSMDESLSRAVALLDSLREQSPFSELVHNATPVQRQVVADYTARIRDAMRKVLEAQQISLKQPHRSSVWAAQMQVLGAAIALEEVDPKRLRGYGEISPDDAVALRSALKPIDDLIDRMQFYLSQGSAADLRERLERLSNANDEIQLLRTMERIITARGLIELRGTLEMLLDRIESSNFEVAVFGRVSSGKSSLLDYILETDVLPVGVTPVTAVPTRIVYGATPQATIQFADADPVVVRPEQIEEFAAEQRNPGNTKHVTKIQVELPAEHLQKGITLVDTPGIGSLALSGAAESMAYLPRCDLGIVLVDSASTLNAEDVAVVDLLHRAGASVQVLLSKADLLTKPEQRQAVDYVRSQLHLHSGLDVSTFAVSSRGEAAALCDTWLDHALFPMMDEHRQLAHESLCRKIGLLRDAVSAALRSAINKSAMGRNQQEWHQAEMALVEAMSKLESAIQQSDKFTASPAEIAKRLLDKVAARMAENWNGSSHSRRTGSDIIRTLTEQTTQMAAERARLLNDTQNLLLDALRRAARATEAEEIEGNLIHIAEMPVIEFDENRLDVPAERSWRAMLGAKRFANQLHNQLEASIGNEIQQIIKRYAKQLDAWCMDTLREMQQVFTARADFYRAHADYYSSQAHGEPGDIAQDLAELEHATAVLA